MCTVNIYELKTNLSKYLDMLEKGDEKEIRDLQLFYLRQRGHHVGAAVGLAWALVAGALLRAFAKHQSVARREPCAFGQLLHRDPVRLCIIAFQHTLQPDVGGAARLDVLQMLVQRA